MKGLKSLVDGFAAIAAGDVSKAHKLARDATALLNDESATRLLSAQAAALSGDQQQIDTHFKPLLANPATEVSALHTLYEQAVAAQDWVAARQHAMQAVRKSKPVWALKAALPLVVQNREWNEALNILETGKGNGTFSGKGVNRLRAALLTEMALATESYAEAARIGKQAIDADGTFIPAVECLASALIRENRPRKAQDAVLSAWKQKPHQRLSALWLSLFPDEDVLKKVNRAEELAAVNPESPESRLFVAEAALAAELWGQARSRLQPVLDAPTNAVNKDPRLAVLMARIEEGENANLSKAMAWMYKAVNQSDNVLGQAAPPPDGVLWGREHYTAYPHFSAYSEMAWEDLPDPSASGTALVPVTKT